MVSMVRREEVALLVPKVQPEQRVHRERLVLQGHREVLVQLVRREPQAQRVSRVVLVRQVLRGQPARQVLRGQLGQQEQLAQPERLGRRALMD